jgi:hypothetical protein
VNAIWNQVERSPSSRRTVAASRSRVPSVPVTRTVAARPVPVVAATATLSSSPGTADPSRRATSASLRVTAQS